LIKVARRAAGDDSERTETLIARAHYFAKGGSDGRVVEILKKRSLPPEKSRGAFLFYKTLLS